MSECIACEIARGRYAPPGGLLTRRDGFVLHAVAAESPLRGWLVLTSERHVRGLSDLDAAELRALGPFAADVMRAQKSALGAEHVYAFAIGDALLHFHLHLVPRFADTPERLRGRKCFDFALADVLDEAVLARAAQEVARALSSSAPK
jgi:diadenosine tetraphosphate (Ap4A) HIT family hydrolase